MRGVGVETQENTICLWKLLYIQVYGVTNTARGGGGPVGFTCQKTREPSTPE